MREMKKYTTIIVLIILVIHCLGSVIPATGIKSVNNVDKNGTERDGTTSISKLVHDPHDPICIDGDLEFTQENGVRNPWADGTEIDPYYIGGWDINASTANGIYIGNTTAYFNISNCHVYDGKSNSKNGIYLYNVTNGKIDSVTSYNNSYGILIENSPNAAIITSIIYNNTMSGIYFVSSNTNMFLCILENNYYGIVLSSSSNVVINNCTVNSISEDIYLTSSSSLVTLNTTFNKTKFGDTTSILTVKWYLHTKVINLTGNPIPDATVRILDNANGTFDQNYKTGSDGWVRWIDCTEYWQNQTTMIYYTPHNVTANKTGYATNYSDVTIDSSKEITIKLKDMDKPAITNIEANPSFQEVNHSVNITCVVTDNVGVSEVFLNITYPDDSYENISITQNKTGNTYYCNKTYDMIGWYNYTILANDTSNNWNNSENYSFDIREDLTKPSITNVNVTPEYQSIGGYVNITCNVTDNVEVDEVYINITGPPDFEGRNETMIRTAETDDYYYNANYSDKGIYYFYIWANDTNKNQNVSGVDQFEIDITGPTILSTQPTPQIQKVNGYVNITCNVTDNVKVDKVFLNITYPNGTLLDNFSMIGVELDANGNGTYYYNTNYSFLGNYPFYIWANDTSDNQNKSELHFFKIVISLLPPTNLSIKINNDAIYTNSASVNLTLEGENATEMAFSENLEDWTDWELWATEYNFNLTEGDGNKTVYFKARNDFNETEPVNDTIILDVTPPNVTLIMDPQEPNGQNNWYASNVTINLTATDNTSMVYKNKILYRIQSDAGWGNWTQYDENITVEEDGIYYIEYNVTDMAGNKANNADNLLEVKIDKTEPDAASMSVIINGNNSYINNLTVVLTLSANDTTSGVKNMSISNDGTNWTEMEFASSYEWELAPGEDGTRYVYFKVTDEAGNSVPEPINDTITLDTTLPTSNYTMSPPVSDDDWTEDDVMVTINGYDTGGPSEEANSGVFQIAFRIGTYSADAWSWGTWNYESNGYKIPFADEGTYKVEYYAIDNATNEGDTGTTTVFSVDKVAPTVTIRLTPDTPDGENDWYTSAVTVTIEATDLGSGVNTSTIEYCYDGVSWDHTYTGPFPVSDEGEHTIYARAADNAGKTGGATPKLFKIDKTDPTLTISFSGTTGENDWYTSDVEVNITAADTALGSGVVTSTIEYSYNEVDWNPYTGVFNVSDEGEHKFYARAKDNAGRTCSASKSLKIDRTDPTVTIRLTPDTPDGENDWYTSAVTVTIEATDLGSGVSSVDYSYDNVSWNTYIEAFTVSDKGEHKIYARAKDNAGRTGNATPVTFKIDKTAPTGTISINMNATYTNTTTVALTLFGNDVNGVASMRFSEDNINYSEWETYNTSKSWNLSAGDGTKTIYVKFKDTAGLESLPINASIILDTKAPILTVSEPENNKKTTESSILIRGYVDEVNVTVKINGVNAVREGKEFWDKIKLVEGKNIIVIIAEDQAGNKNSTTIIIYREKGPIKIDPYWLILIGAIILLVVFVLYEHLKKKKGGVERTTPLEEKVASDHPPGFNAGRRKEEGEK
ncbi:MAG: right-handed parallel beta-helix repeat-containing protein [Thermoplasmatales archaeon]|nr:right-handed parallel beta-helix repeat-containing protein [Thermoplasmatales archaeon]